MLAYFLISMHHIFIRNFPALKTAPDLVFGDDTN